MAPQQARSMRTQQAILDGAAIVFAEKGFAEASLSEIAQAAGVKKSAIYHHFRSKPAIAATVVEAGQVSVEADPAQRPHIQNVVDASLLVAGLYPELPAVRAASRLATEPAYDFYGRLWEFYIPRVVDLLQPAWDCREIMPWDGLTTTGLARVWISSFTGHDIMHRPDPANMPAAMNETVRTITAMAVVPHIRTQLDLSLERGQGLVAKYLEARDTAARLPLDDLIDNPALALHAEGATMPSTEQTQ